MFIASHSMHQMFPYFSVHMQPIWDSICRYCQLKCARRTEGAAYVLQNVHMLIDEHMSLPLEELDGLDYRLVLYTWDPGKMGRFFHYDGTMLETIGATERVVAQSLRHPETSVMIRINQEMRSSGGFFFSWRKVLSHLGFSKPAIAKLLQQEISKYEGNWTRDLIAHMASFKAG